jgi:hypothetical protein
MLTFVHDGRRTSTNIPIFATHAHLASLLLNTICCTGELASFWTTSVIASVRCYTQSLTTGLCPGTQQLTFFRRLSTNSLVALDSVFVIVSKIRPFLRANEVLLGRFFFLTLDGFLIICSCQTVSFTYFEHLFLHLLAVILLKYLVITDDYYSSNNFTC